MPWIVGGAILGGALIGGEASKSAAGTQAAGAGQAAAIQQQMYQQTRGDLAPWMQTGTVALNQLRGLTGLPSDDGSVPYNPNAQLIKSFGLQDFQASPAYQFNLEQGQQAINKGAAARGGFYQPGTLQDIAKFSQGLASNEFQNSFNNYNTNLNNIWSRLYGLSGSGQNAAAGLGGFGTTVGGNIGNAITGGANAQAAGTVGQANALTGGIGQGLNSYWMNQILQRNQAPLWGYNSTGASPGDVNALPW